MRPDALQIVFDKIPQYAVGKYLLTVGKQYQAKAKNLEMGLYSLEDDAGTAFNVTTYGQGYTNGGYWHICQSEGCEVNSCDPDNYEQSEFAS
jgi:hypothetical protein